MLPVHCSFIAVLLAATQEVTIPPVDPAAPPAVHVTIEAYLPDGTPAAEIPIYEVGLERGYIRYGEIGKTDATGRFTVPFHRGGEVDHTKPRGYGLYRYVLMPPAHRWDVSDFYCWNEYPEGGPTAQRGGFGNLSTYDEWFAPDYDGKLQSTDPADNWSYGKGVALYAGQDVSWPVRLDEGELVEMTVVDQDGRPIADAPLQVGIDLRALTRTGVGGYIPIGQSVTDEKGRFHVEHVGDFAYNFELSRGHRSGYYTPNVGYYCWDIDHSIVAQGTTLRFQRAEPVTLQFKVLDATTRKPISGADILPYFMLYLAHPGQLIGTTREGEDIFEVEFPWPLEHVLWFEVAASGYEPGRFMMEKYKAGEVIEIVVNPVESSETN